MKNPLRPHTLAFDSNSVNDTIQRALASAGLDTSSGLMHDVTATIRRALAPAHEANPATVAVAAQAVVDVTAREVDVDTGAATAPKARPSTGGAQAPGTFETRVFSHRAGRWSYKLYVPARAIVGPPPLLVMLHGCTQSAEDFAAGTQMNRIAEEHGLLVVYPEQAAHANATRCWNWFKPQDQLRDAGEPELIAGIVREVASRHGADQRRIFVAGLSAGAAMAVVLGETYPELFAGVGVHSGLPYGCARDVASAMAAMKGGRSGLPGGHGRPVAERAARKTAVQPVPLIVFHGDRDHTVQQSNATEIVRQARDAYLADAPGEARLDSSVQAGTAPGGRRYSRTMHANRAGQTHIEDWTVHGAGHAWSGGDARGSYTDGSGPDASAEMVRFFLALPRTGSA